MKKIILIVFAFLFLGMNVYAVSEKASDIAKEKTESISATPAPTDGPTPILSQNVLDSLKEKIATQVATIVQGTKQMYVGYISAKDANSFTIEAADKKQSIIKADDTLSKWMNVSGSELKSADFKVGDYAIVDGLDLEGTINGNNIYKDTHYTVGRGVVTNYSDSKSLLSLSTQNSETSLELTLTPSAQVKMFNVKTKELDKATAYKLIVGDTVHYVAQMQKGKLTITKLIVIPQELFISNSF